MKIRYDAEVDILSIIFVETTVTTKSLDKGLAADYGEDGRLAGLEILSASKRLGSGTASLQQVVIEGLGLTF